jgi:hypothetical protein
LYWRGPEVRLFWHPELKQEDTPAWTEFGSSSPQAGAGTEVPDLKSLVRTVTETAGWQFALLRVLMGLSSAQACYPSPSLTGASPASRHRTACKEKKERPMPELTQIDPGSATLLVLDYQVDALTRFMTAAQSADAIACVPELIATAPHAGMMVIHVVVAFRPGHSELRPRNAVFSLVKANGMLVADSEGVAIHPAAAPREWEPSIWIIGRSSSGIAAQTRMQRRMQCCSTSSSRSGRPSSPRRSSPAPCLAGLHERARG